jgi:DNA mismatch repair protein MutS2
VTLLDLDPESRRSLELDALLAEVASHAATAAGAARIRALAPLSDALAIDEAQAEVEETRAFLAAKGRLVPAGLPDPAPCLAALSVEGARADPKALRDLASVLLDAGALRAQLAALPADELPRLRRLGESLPDLRREVREIVEHLGPDGEVQDEASPELRRIRTALARSRDRLRRHLEALLHDPSGEAVIRDDFVTQRNGRFVIPVRSDSPRAVPGIVHAASSSGATLFIEPLESVEANNALVRLTEEERAEVERILDLWTDVLRRRRHAVLEAVEGLAAADSLQARAAFAEGARACRPKLARDAPIRLDEARHPMLDRRLREAGGSSVPLTLALDPPYQVLVISGPNTGGKTVALKTVGLAVLMAQSGIPVLASEARLPVFRQVRADIGDHQSVEADLSTFSAHVRAVARFLRGVDRPALFLFDEIGTGTEPGEGAALAQAILEELLRGGGAAAVATTHHGALKGWASTTAGVVSAAMEFDEETLQPTYRIRMGAAGASAGIEIAARLGIDRPIVDRAREILGPGTRQVEETLTVLRARAAEAEALRDEQRRAAAELEESRRRLEESTRETIERQQAEAERSLAAVLDEFRKQARKEVAGIQDKKEQARVEREQLRAESRMRAALSNASRKVTPGSARSAGLLGPVEPVPGMKVRILSLEREGEVVELRGSNAVVRMGSATFTVPRSDLGRAGEAQKPAPPAAKPAWVTAAANRPRSPAEEGDAPGLELHLIGKTVDEALPQLDGYLDRAVRAGMSEVRIVHGHGTGRLRAAVRKFLSGHAHVDAHRPGEPREGGDGATVVTLR